MKFGLTQTLGMAKNTCLVLGICKDEALPEFIQTLDKSLGGIINTLAERATTAGDMVWHMDASGAALVLIQCGDASQFQVTSLKKRLGEVTDALLKQRFQTATIYLPQVANQSADWQAELMVQHIRYQSYQLLDFKKKNPSKHALETVSIYLPGAQKDAVEQAQALAEGMDLTRTLANLPANVCTPTYLGTTAMELAKTLPKVHCKVMGPDEMKAMGMGTLLAVAQGSQEPPRFIEISYTGGDKTAAPVVLVGKGITFDSGGLSLKPANAMDEMKYDMCGAASVLGTIKACALMKLPVNVIGIIPSAENMLSGTAVKPGDIVTSMSGQTVEIINTDAEGRLILADALTYAERFNPLFVIDIATLTGAMVVALGTVATGFITKDDDLAKALEKAALESDDKIWRMPLDDDYQEAIDSPLADMLNATFDRNAGAITAACFLSRFTEKYRWAHLDVAGTAWISGKKRNATGRPVPLLTRLIRHVASSR